MSDPELLAALGPVLRVLADLGVRHFVGGSIASSAHGVARASVDADVVAELAAPHIAPLVAALRETDYLPGAESGAALPPAERQQHNGRTACRS